MKIFPLTNNIKNFSSNCKFGYDDEISQNRREYIRKHLEEEVFGDDDIINSGRVSEYELYRLIKNIRLRKFEHTEKSEDTSVDENMLNSAGFSNLRRLCGKTSLYTASLGGINSKMIQTAKRAGIKNVVYLGDHINEEVFKDIEHTHFPAGWLESEVSLYSEDDYVKKCLKKDSINEPDYSEKCSEYAEKHRCHYRKMKDEFNEKLVKFIQTMQKGNVLMGCECGTLRTNRFICIDYFFNPKADIMLPIVEYSFGTNLQHIYKNLSPKDKEAMGWDEEFDKNFIKRLERYGFWVD